MASCSGCGSSPAGGWCSDRALYGILTRMQGEGLIVLEGINGRRKVYTLTETGQEALLAEYRRLKQMVEDSSVLEEDV